MRGFLPFLLLCVFLMPDPAIADCMLYEVPLQQRSSSSSLIVEAKVLSRASFWDPSHTIIYSAYTLDVSKIFKGKLPAGTLSLVTEGGQVGDTMLVANPGISLSAGEQGIFFLRASGKAAFYSSSAMETYAGVQGVIHYQDDLSFDSFRRYEDRKQLHSMISAIVRQPARTVKSLPLREKSSSSMLAKPMATISGFSPTTITAGTNSTLTISGSGFGTTPGTVQFPDADVGGQAFTAILSGQIISWTDTQIQVRVPSDAGTGTFQVVPSSGTPASSGLTLTITYALLSRQPNNLSPYYTPYLVNDDNSGGYTFTFNTNFSQNIAAVSAYRRAMQSWRCSTFVNFKISGATTTVSCQGTQVDGINLVSFDNSSCTLPAGALGITYNWHSACTGNTVWYTIEVDQIFTTNSVNWNFGPGAPSSSQYDFESVAIHELGHALQLSHIIAPAKVMHYAISNGESKRNLDMSSDVAGGEFEVNRSAATNACNRGVMTKLNSSNCTLIPAPTTDFSANRVSGCVPLSVTFTDLSPGATSWQWDVNNDGTTDYTTQNPTHIYTQPGTYSVKLTAANSGGSNSTTKTGFITVFNLPEANAGSDVSVCRGSSVAIGALAIAGNSYSWTPVTGLSNPSAANPLASPAETGKYALEVTDGNGCISRDTVLVTVNALPQARVSPDTAKICSGTSGILDAGAGFSSYLWSTGETSRTISVTNEGIYWVTVTNNLNCAVTDSAYVRVLPLPGPQISANGPLIFCEGDSVVLSAPPGFGYQWSTGATTQSITVKQSGTFTVVATDIEGCSGPSNQVNVIVQPFPVPVINGQNSVCVNANAQYSVGEIQESIYLWKVTGGTILSGQGTPSISVQWPAAGAGLVSVTVTNPLQCKKDNSISVKIGASLTPVIETGGLSVLCEGSTLTLDAGAGYRSYLWSNGATTRTVTVSEAGNYSVTVTDSSGCSGSSAALTIGSRPKPPAPVISVSGATLTANSSITPSSYQWLYNGAEISGATASTYVVDKEGNYSVRIFDANNCSSESATVFVTGTGVGETAHAAELRLFPQPAGDYLRVGNLPSGWTGVKAGIYNVLGRKLSEAEFVLSATGEVTIPVPDLAPGFYILQIGHEGQKIAVPFAKE